MQEKKWLIIKRVNHERMVVLGVVSSHVYAQTVCMDLQRGDEYVHDWLGVPVTKGSIYDTLQVLDLDNLITKQSIAKIKESIDNQKDSE